VVNALWCNGLRKVYGGTRGKRLVVALDDVSFGVEEGTTLGIVGESGSGKSTLARVVCGLEAPEAGTVCICDTDITSIGPRLPSIVQLVFQDPYTAINPRDSIARALGEALVPGMRSRRKLAPFFDKMEGSLREVGLPPDVLSRRPAELSGGQLQRVVLARALLKGPKILVCDEPTASLDVSIQAQVLNLLVRLQREHNLTMLFISHDLRIIHHISDAILVLRNGRVREVGPAESVWEAPQDSYTQELLSSVAGAGASMRSLRRDKVNGAAR